ncbi:MAG: PLP-dependent lyase/thiolase [Acidimicrobiales bacterium]|nr:PLP-dependent lyase/thiolase [Acidimicrobiales bacterium]
MERPLIGGWRCAVCGRTVDIAEPFSWRCPGAVGDDRHHALELVQSISPLRSTGDTNPFLGFRRYLAVDAFMGAHGLTDVAREALIAGLDAQVAAVEGTGFVTTPFFRADELSAALGFTPDGGVWVKDETHNVGGSHKARHLFTILVHLVAAEQMGVAPWASAGAAARPSLAIASCGNAALAAATLAAAVAWPIRVFVPPSANLHVTKRLGELGAEIVVCPRQAGDPPGDPCVHRFREAVAAGAVPFGVQGPENAWCLDGGRTIGWELAVAMDDIDASPFDRLFVQVGGGAFAACVAAGLAEGGRPVRLHAVQTEHCAPLERAWQRSFGVGGPAGAAAHWDECMWPWEHVGASAADGILDDETYDWIPIVRAMAATGGAPVVVSEAQVLEANDLLRASTSIDASATGTAGLAGLLAVRDQLDPGERVVVIASGVRR